MGRNFANVLAVIDLQKDDDICFRAAIGIANRFGSNLHVIYRHQKGEVDWSCSRGKYDHIKAWTLQNHYQEALGSISSLHIHIIRRRTRKTLLGYIGRNKIDLIVIWKRGDLTVSSAATWLHANSLSRKTGCPVLCLHRHADIQSIRNIVLPVQDSLPTGKLMLALRLAGLNRAKIHLIGFVSRDGDSTKDSFFLKACQLLQYHRNMDVECKMLEGIYPAGTMVKYVNKVNADLILVCASPKPLIYGMLSLLLSARNSAVSRAAVMTIPVEQLNAL
jgi:hypothetical protein